MTVEATVEETVAVATAEAAEKHAAVWDLPEPAAD